MEVLKRLIGVVASVALAVTFVAAGFLVCLAPPVTSGLSSMFAKDDLSPFNRTQLVKVAEATRDFSFGSHDELGLYQVIYQIDCEYRDDLAAKGGKVGVDFPKVNRVTDQDDLDQLRSAFEGASEWYCFSPETVAHLDDCHQIVVVAYPLLAVIAALAVVAAVFSALLGRKSALARVLVAAGTVVIVAAIGLGAWAAIDFNSFFAQFHQVFFSQGNWTFPYDSLLICALPTEFWMGMGALWLVVTALASILSIVIGIKLIRRA